MLRRLLETTGSIQHARDQAHRLVERAKSQATAALPPGPATDLLGGLADAVTARDR
jgi:geranylgeranyl pyrophosphate synthase